MLPPGQQPRVQRQWQEPRAGGDVFQGRGGRVLYLASLSETTEAAKAQMGRLNQGSNIRAEGEKGPKISCGLRERRCIVLLSSLPHLSTPTICETD